MENNYNNSNHTPAQTEQDPYILNFDLRSFIQSLIAQPLPASSPKQRTYKTHHDLDYLLAISG